MIPCRKLLLFILFSLSCKVYAQNVDIELLKPINEHQTYFKDKYLELCASSVTAVSIAAPVGILAAGLIKHDKKLQKDALYIGGAYILSAVITQGTKRIVGRQRPFEEYSYIVKRDDESGGMSFPSGHTSAAFATATSLSLRYRKWYVMAPAYIWAGSVGWARMYQGVHYPSDVLTGAIVGAGSAWLGYTIQKWMDKRHARKNPQ